jgi:hypothetical protein
MSASYARHLPQPIVKTIDLVDVVAGGNGFSGKRGRGIDPATGKAVSERSDPPKGSQPMHSDGKYHRVTTIPFVDGIGIPHRKGPVQLDSAGNCFDGFENSDAATWQHLWAGGLMNSPLPRYSYPTEMGGVDYAVPPHGLLLLHANLVATFNLDAIRKANPGYKLSRFRAMTGNTETVSAEGQSVSGSIWVFVDGKVRFRRREINRFSGVMPATIPISESDHFLTLAASDNGNGIVGDWLMFGDPRLELSSSKTNDTKASDEP